MTAKVIPLRRQPVPAPARWGVETTLDPNDWTVSIHFNGAVLRGLPPEEQDKLIDMLELLKYAREDSNG